MDDFYRALIDVRDNLAEELRLLLVSSPSQGSRAYKRVERLQKALLRLENQICFRIEKGL
jgi:hypothetical protein